MFYPRDSAMLTKEHFANCFQVVGFSLTPDELNLIWTDLEGEGKASIELIQFYSKLSCWKGEIVEKVQRKPDVIKNLNMELLNVIHLKRWFGEI